ncbi:hypothetical protein [Pedomonas sp. V897]|uniref:hypothetical protein n=1 Tax=Pedomonas sp. V897 TaxID=3446482 RepID=UPI003EDFB334
MKKAAFGPPLLVTPAQFYFYSRQQPDISCRAEAIRRLVDLSLEASKAKGRRQD